MYLIKNKRLLLLLLIVITGMVVNSCKKESQSPIQALFTTGSWQLASVLVFHYTGPTATSTDTLNTNCDSTQVFTFYKNNTCIYTNFDCVPQKTASASWSLTPNQLYLESNVVCKDTTAVGSSTPFSNAKIVNLGQFSLVLQTGDIQPNYSLTQPRTIIQYGFINKNALGD